MPLLLPPPNAVCFLPLSLRSFVLTDDPACRQSSRLRFGPLPPPYGAITPDYTGGPFQRRTPMVTRYWLTTCLAVILFQTVLTICRSDALATFIDLESAAHRASREKLALVVERGKSEQEREKIRRDRDLWEKAWCPLNRGRARRLDRQEIPRFGVYVRKHSTDLELRCLRGSYSLRGTGK